MAVEDHRHVRLESHNALPAGAYGFPAYTLRSVGLVSQVPFTTPTFSVAGTFGMVIDDITCATFAPEGEKRPSSACARAR